MKSIKYANFCPSLTKPIPRKTIRAVVKHIAEKFQPEEIILFGSYAYGKPQPSSDVDLLVVMETPKGELKTSLEILQSLPRITFSLEYSRAFPFDGQKTPGNGG